MTIEKTCRNLNVFVFNFRIFFPPIKRTIYLRSFSCHSSTTAVNVHVFTHFASSIGKSRTTNTTHKKRISYTKNISYRVLSQTILSISSLLQSVTSLASSATPTPTSPFIYLFFCYFYTFFNHCFITLPSIEISPTCSFCSFPRWSLLC